MKSLPNTEFIDLIALAKRMDHLYNDENLPFVFCEFEVLRDEQGNRVGDRFLSMTRSCKSFWGYEAEEMIGKSYKMFENPQNTIESEKIIKRNVENGEAADMYRNEYVHKDGTLVKNCWLTGNANDDVIISICFRDPYQYR